MGECGECGTAIMVSDNPLVCGICSKVFHQRCTDLKKQAAKLIADYENVLFKCDNCVSGKCCGVRDDGADAGELQREIEKLASISGSFIGTRDNIEVQIKLALEKETTKLIESFNVVLRDSLASFENSVARKLEDLKSLIFEKNCRDKKLAEMSRKRTLRDASDNLEVDAGPSKKQKSIVNGSDSDDEVFNSGSAPTFASVLSGKSGKKNKTESLKKESKARPVIVIKPVEVSKTSEDTRQFLKTNLDPRKHKIGNFRNGKDGSIIAECAIGENVELVKNDIESSLGGNFNAVIPNQKPKVKIVGMSDRYSADEFVDLLKSQNNDIGINEVKVIAEFENPRFKYNKYNVIIEVDKDTYQCLMNARKVSIGWDKCVVYEAFNVLRCFKCGEYGHKSTECKNNETCSKCNGNHRTSECTSTDFKCINCLKTNQDRKMNLDVGHPAYSVQCPVFQRLVERKRKQFLSSK